MNAYELADKLILPDCFREYIIDSVIMLRQQADRIAELENREKFIQNFAEEQHKRACDLENKPVKQLSDEEIANIWAEHTKIAGTYDVKDIIFPFARAIIKEITE